MSAILLLLTLKIFKIRATLNLAAHSKAHFSMFSVLRKICFKFFINELWNSILVISPCFEHFGGRGKINWTIWHLRAPFPRIYFTVFSTRNCSWGKLSDIVCKNGQQFRQKCLNRKHWFCSKLLFRKLKMYDNRQQLSFTKKCFN